MAKQPRRLARRAGLGFAGISAAALAAALIAEHVFGLRPCALCLTQRQPYMLAIALGLVTAALAPSQRLGAVLVALLGVVFLAGAGIAGYHAGVEYGAWAGPSGCSAPALQADSIEALRAQIFAQQQFVPCDEVPWSLFGISMAGYNFLLSTGLAFASLLIAWRLACPLPRPEAPDHAETQQ